VKHEMFTCDWCGEVISPKLPEAPQNPQTMLIGTKYHDMCEECLKMFSERLAKTGRQSISLGSPAAFSDLNLSPDNAQFGNILIPGTSMVPVASNGQIAWAVPTGQIPANLSGTSGAMNSGVTYYVSINPGGIPITNPTFSST
jgi:hypothetical protein